MVKSSSLNRLLRGVLDPDKLYTYRQLYERTGVSRSTWERAKLENEIEFVQGVRGRKGSTVRVVGESAIRFLERGGA